MDARLKQEAAKRDSPAEVTPLLVEAAAAPVERAAAEAPVAAKAPATLSRRPSMDARLKLEAAKRDSPAGGTEAAEAGDAVGAAVGALAARICANVVREASGAAEAAGVPRLSA